MASSYFQFQLAALIIFLGGIQEGLLVPSPVGNNIEHLNQMIDIGALLNRLDQLEASRDRQQVQINSQQVEINSQQIEIDQLKKKNTVLEEQLHQTSKKTSSAERVITRKPSSCLDLLDLGHTLTGFYDVLPQGSGQIASIYCDFSFEHTEADFETQIGFVDVKSVPVHFFVTRITSWSSGGNIPFETEHLNLGGGMNLTSGVFTAPKAGIYAFSFKGAGYESSSSFAGRGVVYLTRNNANVAIGVSYINGATSATVSTVSVHGTLKLNKGDTVTIRFGGGTIYSDSNSQVQFTGSLLEEDFVIS